MVEKLAFFGHLFMFIKFQSCITNNAVCLLFFFKILGDFLRRDFRLMNETEFSSVLFEIWIKISFDRFEDLTFLITASVLK